MGGFSNVFGHVATGFEQARQIDAQRQFEAEENRRQQIGGFLQKLALDETAHPHTRNAAIEQYLKMTQSGKWKPDIEALIPPPEPKSMTTPGLSAPAPPPGSAQPSFSAGAPGEVPQMSMPAPPPGLSQAMAGAGAGQVSTPGQAGAFTSPAEVTQMAASRAGAVAGAQAKETMAAPIYTQAVPGGPLTSQPISHAGTAMGPGIPNAVSPYQLQGRGLRPTVYIDPADNQPKIGTHNLLNGDVLNQDNQVVPNAIPFEPSLLTKGGTSTQSMNAAGEITTKRTTGPVAGGPGTGGKKAGATTAGGTVSPSAKPSGSPHVT